MQQYNQSRKGFTLAELLISLAILGVIATFTIPKILGAATSGQNTAIAKEGASMVSGAFQSYTLNNSLATGTTAGVLTPFMNYVNVDSSSFTIAGANCNATITCLNLHNGGKLAFNGANTFTAVGVGTTGAISYFLDPDGSGTATAVQFVMFSTGRLTTGGQAGAAGTAYPTPTGFTAVASDPAYLANWQ